MNNFKHKKLFIGIKFILVLFFFGLFLISLSVSKFGSSLKITFTKEEARPVKVLSPLEYIHRTPSVGDFDKVKNDPYFKAIYEAFNRYFKNLNPKLIELLDDILSPIIENDDKSVAFYFTKEGAKIDPKTSKAMVTRREINLWKFWKGNGQKGKDQFLLESPNNDPTKFTLSVNGGTWIEEVIKLRPLAVAQKGGVVKDSAVLAKKVREQFNIFVRRALGIKSWGEDGVDGLLGPQGKVGDIGAVGNDGENGERGLVGKEGINTNADLFIILLYVIGALSLVSLILLGVLLKIKTNKPTPNATPKKV